jgi:hypothetical protein
VAYYRTPAKYRGRTLVWRPLRQSVVFGFPRAVLTFDYGPPFTEAEIVLVGFTLTITLTGTTWVTAGATFDAERQNIINGIDSDGSAPAGWDAVVKAGLVVTDVVRTSDTVVTIVIPAFGAYNIAATETITVTVPATAVVATTTIIATPTFSVTAVGAAIGPFIGGHLVKHGILAGRLVGV